MSGSDDEIIDVVNTDDDEDMGSADDDGGGDVVRTQDDVIVVSSDSDDDDEGKKKQKRSRVAIEQASNSSSDSSIFHNYAEIDLDDDDHKKIDFIRSVKSYKSMPNILARKSRKRKFNDHLNPTMGRRKKDDPDVKDRVLKILKVAQTEMIKEPTPKRAPIKLLTTSKPRLLPMSMRVPIAKERATYCKFTPLSQLPSGPNGVPFGQLRVQLRNKKALDTSVPEASSSIRLKAIEGNPGDDLNISRALSQISQVEMSSNKNGDSGKQCFVISDKLRTMINEFKANVTTTVPPELPKKLKSHHLDLLVEIEEQCSEECDGMREKQWIMDHLGTFCGIYPVALVNRILRRRQEMREDAIYLDRVVGTFDKTIKTKPIQPAQKVEESDVNKGDVIVNPTNLTLAELGELRLHAGKEQSRSPEKNTSVAVPPPKYFIFNPNGRVFKINPDQNNKLQELSKVRKEGDEEDKEGEGDEKGVKTEEEEDRAPELEAIIPLPADYRREKKTSDVERKRKEAGEDKKKEKDDDALAPKKKEAKEEDDEESQRTPSPPPKKSLRPSSSSASTSDESPKKKAATCPPKPRKIVRRILDKSEPSSFNPDSSSCSSLKMCLKMKLDVPRRVIANENRFAIVAIKRRIDDLRLERAKLQMHVGRVAEKMNHIEQNAIPVFLTRLSTWPREAALDAHKAKIDQFKDLKMQRQNLVEKIDKINVDIDKLLTVDLQLFCP